jgi:DNA-binding CsgD family transcriptional regulator
MAKGVKQARDRLKELEAALLEQQPLLDEPPAEHALALMEHDPWSGLTNLQKQVQALKLKGISQRVMANVLQVSQTTIFKELEKIREIHCKNGASLDTNTYVGETISTYEELSTQGWKGFMSISDDQQSAHTLKLQYLQFIGQMTREKTKMLMDLGYVKKAKMEIELSAKVNDGKEEEDDFVAKLKGVDKAKLAGLLLEAGLTQLEEPEPEDAEIE